MSKMISLIGLDKATVLATLYNASRPQGKGFMQYDAIPMAVKEARAMIASGKLRFDYLKGRVMKIDLSGDELDTWGYDRDNGENAAWMAIEAMQKTGDANSPSVQIKHNTGKETAADQVLRHIDEDSKITERDGTMTVRIGFSDVADPLRKAVKKATRR